MKALEGAFPPQVCSRRQMSSAELCALIPVDRSQ